MKPIDIPAGVAVKVDGNQITVTGPKGELTRRINPDMAIRQDDGTLVVERPTDQRQHRALHGLTRALLNNMIQGVSSGYEIRLEVVGTGYRAEMEGPNLRLSLGYSHDVLVFPPPTVSFQVENRGALIIISSIDKELIGQVAADVRKLRPPEPYKGKGIKFEGEEIRRKAGKSKIG
jgi:large subunit ribosomal protein L6